MSGDPFTNIALCYVKGFGKAKLVRAETTQRCRSTKSDDYGLWDISKDNVLWVERAEDLYGSHHFAGKEAIRVRREDWLAAGNVEDLDMIRDWRKQDIK